MKTSRLIVPFSILLILIMTSFKIPYEALADESDIVLSINRSDKQKVRTHGIEGQEILIEVKTKEWDRKQDTTTEFWLTAWSTYEGKTVKSKLHRFMGKSDNYDELLVFRHYDKRNGVKEIKINLHIELK